LETPTEKLLLSYSLDVEYWDEWFGETHLLLGNREALSKRQLSLSQRLELERTDQAAERKLANHIGEETMDVKTLRWAVEVIQADRARREAQSRQAA
jgi:hypothetical protein